MEDQRFPKSCRLLDSLAFERVFEQPDFRVSNKFLLILGRQSQLGEARLGVIVAKKNIARATQRNRIKRHIREAFRLKKSSLAPLDLVVMARKGLDHVENEKCRTCIDELMEEIEKKYSAS